MLLPGPRRCSSRSTSAGSCTDFARPDGGLGSSPAIVLLLGCPGHTRASALPAATGLLLGLKAAVLALVLQALLRIGRRALGRPLHVALAIAAFVALEVLACRFR